MNIDYFAIQHFQENHLSLTRQSSSITQSSSLPSPKPSLSPKQKANPSSRNLLMDDMSFPLEANPDEEKIFLTCNNSEDAGNIKPETSDFEEIHGMNISEFLFPPESKKKKDITTTVRNQDQIKKSTPFQDKDSRDHMPFPNMLEKNLLGKVTQTKERLLPEFSEMSPVFFNQDSTIIPTLYNQGQPLVDDDETVPVPQQKNAKIGKIQKTPKKETAKGISKRKRNTLTIKQKLDKLPYNYIKKVLGGILVKEITNDHHNEFLVFCGAGINVNFFKAWLSKIKYGRVQICKEVWSHKEWDETKGQEHTFKVALTKITQSFLERNGANKWIQDSCRKEDYKNQYKHIETVILQAMNSSQPESLNFQKLFI